MSKANIYLSCIIAVFITSVASASVEPQCTGAGTLQTWTFDTLTNPTLPEIFDNQFGTPIAELCTTQNPPDLFGWMDITYGRQGVWSGDPLNIKLTIPNQPIPNAYKEIWLEMDFQQNLESIKVTPSPVCCSIVEEIFRDISPVDSFWSKLIIGWRIEPNPNEETICISIAGTGGLVDYITVETCCVPEPVTIALLGMGALVLFVRQKR